MAWAREKCLVMHRGGGRRSGTQWDRVRMISFGRVVFEVGAEAQLHFWLCCSTDCLGFHKQDRTMYVSSQVLYI